MNNAQSRAIARKALFLCFSLVAFTLLYGCEDPGAIGGGFTDTGTEVRVDTVLVDGVDSNQFDYYTGNLNFLSAGTYSDPVFGRMEAIGLLRPVMISSGATIADTAQMKLRLIIDQDDVYGDTVGTASYDVIELNQDWRGKAWKITDEPTYRMTQNGGPVKVGSFTVGTQDSMDIDLSYSWLQKYREQLQEDAENFRLDLSGLAIVPQDSGKIVPFEANESGFVIVNQPDTLEFGFNDWAYSLKRTGASAESPELTKLHSTFEQVLKLDMDLQMEDLNALNLSRVELVLHEDQERLESSLENVSSTDARSDIASARLHIFEPDEVPVGLERGGALANGFHNTEDGTYRFNITAYTANAMVNGLPEDLEYYVTLQNLDGVIRSTLIYNEQAPDAMKPKLIVTYIENQ